MMFVKEIHMKSFLRNHNLIAGILLMFIFTWPIDLANAGLLHFKVPYVISITFGWGIIFASLIMTSLALGKDGIVRLIQRFLIWRVGWMWYLAAFLLLPTIYLSAVLIHAAWTGSPIDFSTVAAHIIFGASANLPTFILPFFIFDFLTNGEEMGWRGYVLPRLQAKYSALVSSVILGAIWGLWHLPRYLAPENSSSFALGTLKIFAEAILYTWIYNNTKGSLLLTTIMHATGNTAGVFLPMANTLSGSNLGVLVIAIVIEVMIAVLVTVVAGPEKLSHGEDKQVQTYSYAHL
jgi:membrane protease YdiL (CAAX protease family)